MAGFRPPWATILSRTPTSGFKRDFSRYAWATLTWIPLVVFVNDHVFEITSIRGPSMSPYFNERHNESTSSDVCLTWKWCAQRALRRGQIVTFRNPMNPEALTTKRVVALPGDLVLTRPPFPNAQVRVPQGHIWVEGDQGGNLTLDSNTYGPISINLVEGRITFILWPFRKAGRVKWWEHPAAAALRR